MSEVTKENMLFHLKHGCSFYPVCPICNAIRALITDYPRLKAKCDALRGKVTREGMLDRIDTLRMACNAWGLAVVPESHKEACPECPIGKCKEEIDAILRLVDDVERWKDLEKHLGPRDAAYRVLMELRDHKYGGEEKP